MFAFTLAEVLITLVIIGVIAAITVPTLMNKTNNQETVVRLKKAYSVLSQATNQIIAENGPVTAWNMSNVDEIYELYKKQLRTAKECGYNSGCFTQGAYTNLNNSGTTNYNVSDNTKKLVLADGTQINFDPDPTSACNVTTGGSTNVCAKIQVDINGAKKPNVIGRDLFAFVLKENGLYPRGCDTDVCVGTWGGGCACKVLREGAINY